MHLCRKMNSTYKKLGAGDTRRLDSLPDSLLVAVPPCTVDMPISSLLDRKFDRFGEFLRRRLPCPYAM